MNFNYLLNAGQAADSTVMPKEQITELVQKVSSMSTEDIISWGLSSAIGFASKIAIAIIVYLIGRWIIKRINLLLKRLFEARKLEVSLSSFIISIVNISLSIVLILTTISLVGINTTSFLAIFASAGLAVGMALSGTLQNFAGGVLILFLKPFKVGDFIEAQGYLGTVKEISLFSTLLNTPDNKMIIIPNGDLSTDTINNYSKENTRRVQWIVGVAYGSDFVRVKSVLQDMLAKHKLVLQDHDKFVSIEELGDSSVNFVVRAWCESKDYWTLFYDINESVYTRFNEEGIEFPFPQMDVHLTQKN